MTDLTLDLTECYDPDGAWLGDELLRREICWMSRFQGQSFPHYHPQWVEAFQWCRDSVTIIRPHPEKEGETMLLRWDYNLAKLVPM